MTKHKKMKTGIMSIIKKMEEREARNDFVDLLIDDELSADDSDFDHPAARDAVQLSELPRGAAPQISAPAEKTDTDKPEAESSESEQTELAAADEPEAEESKSEESAA